MADNEDTLKKLIEPTIDTFYRALCLPLIGAMRLVLDKQLGPKSSRIGVFGPYPKGGTQVILKVAQMVSEMGFNVVTGLGAYEKNRPDRLFALMDYFPNHAKKVKKIIPDRVLFHEITRLVSKAVFFENDERGQYEELKGCLNYKVPSLGFVRHSKILGVPSCEYLVDKKTYTECMVAEASLCTHETGNHYCPFYDAIDVPWFTKEILLCKEYGNRFVAVRNLPALKKVIREFLTT